MYWLQKIRLTAQGSAGGLGFNGIMSARSKLMVRKLSHQALAADSNSIRIATRIRAGEVLQQIGGGWELAQQSYLGGVSEAYFAGRIAGINLHIPMETVSND